MIYRKRPRAPPPESNKAATPHNTVTFMDATSMRPLSALASASNQPLGVSPKSGRMLFWTALLLLSFISVPRVTAMSEQEQQANWLTQDSVVLIVGATTSLLGSEVALALYRLFDCQVVMVNDLAVEPAEDISNELFQLEFQRQSLFRVWQELDDHLSVYRMNPRPIIPDIDPGTTVDRLAHVFEKHRPTHVLAFPETPESYHGETDSDPPRAGMLEGVLQHSLNLKDRHPEASLPHVVWTSSEEVYPSTGFWSEKDNPPLPQTKDGADSMVDEVIARSFDEKGIPSVALRLSKHVYGPFQELSAPFFTFIQNALNKKEGEASESSEMPGDFLFVDDAVDAVLAALQLPAQPHTFALNVASGDPSLTTEQVKTLVQNVASGEPREESKHSNRRRLDISLARQILNFSPRVTLMEGLQRSFAWHYDRMFPYGGGTGTSSDLAVVRSMAKMYGISSCTDASDTECLKGVPILPCASECSHQEQCRPTAWDGVLPKLQSRTASCPVVFYTIRPIAAAYSSFDSSARRSALLPEPQCNIAFVPDPAPGDITIQQQWTIVPIQADPTDLDAWLVPLWSPGKLFPQSQWAIYSPPYVLWDDLDTLVAEAQTLPEGGPGSIAMMMGRGKIERNQSKNSSQRHAYRAIHIKMAKFFEQEWLHDGFLAEVEADSWIVHHLGHPDSEQMRCDISREISGWKGFVDFSAAAAFVFGVHDVMSQVLSREKGTPAWWYGEVPSGLQEEVSQKRRLEEKEEASDEETDERDGDTDADESHVEDSEEDEEELQDIHHFDHNGFGTTRKSITADVENELNAKQKSNTAREETGNSRASMDDDMDEKVSIDDNVWLGVLSSSTTQMFVRLVKPESVGAIRLDAADAREAK